MIKKIIASDIDGTLIPYGTSGLSSELFDLIFKLKQKGVLFAPASGRNYKNLRELFNPVKNEIAYLSENGAAVWDKNKLIHITPIEEEIILEVSNYLMKTPNLSSYITTANHNYVMDDRSDFSNWVKEMFGKGCALIDNLDQVEEPILKVTAFCRPDSSYYFFDLKERFKHTGLDIAAAGPNVVDFTIGTKGSGLKHLAQSYNLDSSDVIAFGDNYNDIPMLEFAETSFMVKTDDPTLIKAGTYLTEDVIGEIREIEKKMA